MTLYLGGKAVSVNSMVTTEKEKTKLGFTIDNFIGDLSDDGVLTSPKSMGNTLDFLGVVEWKTVADYLFAGRGVSNILFPDLKIISGNMSYTFAQNAIKTITFPSLKTINGACDRTFNSCNNLTSAFFPELEEIIVHKGGAMFSNCYQFTTCSMPKLKRIYGVGTSQGGFQNCSKLVEVDMSSLENIEGYYACQGMFNGCSKIENIDLHSLKTIGTSNTEGTVGGECYTMFSSCSALSTVDLSGLEVIRGKNTCQTMFQNCKSLTSMSFPSLTIIDGISPMINMFQGCTALTEIHFRADMQTTVEALSEYSNKFGATNATIYFDL